MSNARRWVTQDGREMRIKDMGDDHLINATKMIIERNFRRDYLKDMFREIRRRNMEFNIDVPLYEALELKEIDDQIVKEIKKEQKVKTRKSQSYTVLRRPKLAEAKR